MKVICLFIFSILLTTCASLIGEIEIPIQSYNKSINTLSPNVELHKDKDVEILRNPFLDLNRSENTLNSNWKLQKDNDIKFKVLNSDSENENRIFYTCIIYRVDNGVLKGYQTHMSFLNNFNKATYQWINDSTVTINFMNKFHSSKKYTVMGYGSTTLLGWKD